MTDAEKELRQLAELVRDHPGKSIRLAVACSSHVVLALLDRIEALEKRVAEAECKGAEEMRKAIVIRLRETARGLDEVAEVTDDSDSRQQDLCRAWGYEDAAEDAALLMAPVGAP